MKTCSLGFGKRSLEFSINETNYLGELLPNQTDIGLTGQDEVRQAILNPVKSRRLRDIVKPGEKIVIITSDITRPMPSKTVLPVVLEELQSAGVKDSDVKIVFALGSHRPHTEQEKRYLVGDGIYDRITCIDSDASDCVRLGITSAGTPVDIFRPVACADRRICLGNIEYHYFAGYSGGVKAIMPGVSTRQAIQANHSRMVEEAAHAGNIETNPVRTDIDEVVKFVPVDFIVNVVLDDRKQIVKAVAGHHLEAHREGCRFLDRLYKVKIPARADIVVTSPGGYPKDINLYQAQKALDNARHAVKKGGIIILVASCKEGLGEKVFEKWMLETCEPADLIKRIRDDFQLGGHKAAAIAMVLQHSRIYLVSELETSFVKSLFMEPFTDLQSAVNQALEELGQNAGILVMPAGGSTLPVMEM